MTRPVRVLMFCSQFRPIIGGAERQAELLARTLLRQGCHVEVLTPRKRPDSPLHEDSDGLVIHRCEVTDLTARFSRVRGLGVPNLLLERGQIRRAVRRLLPEFDLLHAHLASPLVAFAQEEARALGKQALCKIACGGRGFDFIALRRGSLLGPRIERGLVERMDRWVAISDEVRANLQEAGVRSDRITCIPNGIDVAACSTARARSPARRFLLLGRLGKFEIENLLAAFRDLVAEVPDVELRIVGPGDTDSLRQRIEGIPVVAGRVEVVGFSPSASEFARADALVHPSRAEGLSNALLEAMASGLPCAASDIPPNRELLAGGKAGLLFPLGGKEGVHAALRRLALEPGLSSQLATAGRRIVDSCYAIDVVARRYRALYQEMVGSARSAALEA